MTLVANRLIKKGMRIVQQLDQPEFAPVLQQENVLQQLVRRASQTAFGRHYNFQDMLLSGNLVENFQQQVPIHDYDKIFDQWWSRALNGEPDVAWRGQVKYFALSSGTSGASSKYIPVTLDMTKSMRRAGFRMFTCLPKYRVPASFYSKQWLMIGGSASLQDMGHCFAGDLSGINASKPPFWIKRFYKPGTRIAQISNWDERTEAIVKMARHWDVSVVTGIPSWVQLTLEHIVEHYKLNNIHELWPNLQVYVSGGTAFEPYRKSFEKLLGKPLIYQDSYLASEGFIAFQSRPGARGMRLLLNNNIFYEFVPFNEENFDEDGKPLPTARAVSVGEVEEGVDYAILLTTCAGAWRYLLGDTVRFTDKKRCEVIITGRTKHFLSICGEHLSVDNMNEALRLTGEATGVDTPEFTVCGIKSGSHFAHHWYVGCDVPLDPHKFAHLLDEKLKIVNDDYKAERSAMLRPPKVTLIPHDLFLNWQREQGKMNGQSKFPRVMKPEQFQHWEQFIEAQTRVL